MSLKNIILGLVVLCVGNVFSQTENVISNGGNTNTTATGSITWTVGETIINTIESPDVHITQGFNQDWLNFLSVESFTDKIELNIFPNPTTQYVNIKSSKKTNLVVFDLTGKAVLSQSVSKNQQIDLSNFSAGTYVFQFTRNNSKVKTIKVIIQ